MPLAFRYGISETITCTIDSLSDSLYHLLEYYVHSDVPLACRIPTAPLDGSSTKFSSRKDDIKEKDRHKKKKSKSKDKDEEESGDELSSTPFTPMTFAVQGTLQYSHLHMWTDLNVLFHRSTSIQSKGAKPSTHHIHGQVVAGSAYSFPLAAKRDKEGKLDRTISVPLDPWAAGKGSKIVRGEPVTFTFRVGWVDESDISFLSAQPHGSWGAFGMMLWPAWLEVSLLYGGIEHLDQDEKEADGMEMGCWATYPVHQKGFLDHDVLVPRPVVLRV